MTKTPRLLIVEDREDDFLLLLHEFERAGYRCEYTRVDTTAGFEDALRAGGWDLVVSDYSLPDLSAPYVLERASAVMPDVPCIVMSSTITEEAAVDLLRAGARDFVSKERMARLVPAIQRELREAGERRARRASEAALQEARERLEYVVESVGIGTWEADLRSGRVSWSRVLERIHGLEVGAFGGTFESFVALIHPEDRAAVMARIDAAKRDRLDYRIEYRTIWPDTSVHWLMGIGRVSADESGAPVRAVGVGMDITAQKNLEEQVRQAQKMESIGNLAGGVAHDFNNLLTIIAGECELMSSAAAPDPEMSASLDAIRIATISASALTRQLLTFSRRQLISPKLMRLDDHINAFRTILRRLVEENVSLVFELNAPRAVIRVDQGQIEQVLLNLVANARDAMPDGGTVTIATREVRGDGAALLELSVSDTGVGIPAQVRPHLFEPFFTTKPTGYGTGLGLATVHGIVTQSGGTIAVDSAPGHGATFNVRLPIAKESAKTLDEMSRTNHSPAPATAGETILVIEDNAALRGLAERILRKAGYRVLTAGTGEQARQICREHAGTIALLLADVVMPDGSGPSAAEWICSQRPQTKVVYMSGYTGDASQVAGKGDAFIQKPFLPRTLVEVVEEVLG